MRKILGLMKKNILLYTILTIIFYIGLSYIFWGFNLAFMNWVNILVLFLFSILGIYGTKQFFEDILKSNKIRKCFKTPILAIEIFLSIGLVLFILFFSNSQRIVKKDGIKMVKETHSFLFSNWIKYYDYKGLFLRGKNARIYEFHNNSIGEYLYSIYYDENGNVIEIKDFEE